MARKTTYRQKFLNKEGLAEQIRVRRDRVEIDPAIQLPYSEGKMILIDKPLHWTSFDVVRKMRGMLQIKKIGHAGTLDPLATGLLIICTGKHTKKINEYMSLKKEYTGHFTLGATTPTYDLESLPEQCNSFDFVTIDLLNKTASTFTGDILQVPPIYSAIKKDGVAAYELARRGEEIDLKARPLHIYEFHIKEVALPVVSFKVVCSTGTYIRSLAHDFGQALGCGAYLSSLRRTAIGDCKVEDAETMESFELSLKSVL